MPLDPMVAIPQTLADHHTLRAAVEDLALSWVECQCDGPTGVPAPATTGRHRYRLLAHDIR